MFASSIFWVVGENKLANIIYPNNYSIETLLSSDILSFLLSMLM